jgi:hypothetical protein
MKIIITEDQNKKLINHLRNIKEDDTSLLPSADAFKKLLDMITNSFGKKDSDESKPKQIGLSSSIPSGPKNVLGSGWKSCKAWRSKGGLNAWGKNISITETPNQFQITYKGPSSGLSIAHAANGKDTIHQLYNVLICELNPFLAQGKMKPNIEGIRTEGSKDGKNSTLTITVPLDQTNDTYQLDRRGGWGHDPGSSKMNKKCSDINSKGGKCFGPVKNVVQARFGKITEYFITYTI